MDRYLKDKYLGLFACIAFSIYLIVDFISNEKIDYETELIEIQGPLKAYSFEDNIGWKRISHRYVIMIENYSNFFQVKADYLGYFQHVSFMETVQEGDLVTLTIPPSQRKKLNSKDPAFVTSVRAKYRTYLSYTDVIEQEKSKSMLYLAGVFIILGFIFYKFRDSWD